MKKKQLLILISFLILLFSCAKTTVDVKIENYTWSGCYVTFKEIDKSSGDIVKVKLLYYGESANWTIKKGNTICYYSSGTCTGSHCWESIDSGGTYGAY